MKLLGKMKDICAGIYLDIASEGELEDLHSLRFQKCYNLILSSETSLRAALNTSQVGVDLERGMSVDMLNRFG